MKTTFIVCAFLAATAVANAQNGANIGMGGSEGNYASLAEKVANLEKKNDAFNVYFNYAASFRTERDSRLNNWNAGFANKQLRLEIKGNIGITCLIASVTASTKPTRHKAKTTLPKQPTS